MSHWNYRVTKRDFGSEVEFAIREVYYADDGRIISWTQDIIGAADDTPEGVIAVLHLMLEAGTKPVVDITDEENPKEI